MNDKIAAPMNAKPDLPALPEAELWVATGLRGLEIHQPNHVVGVSPAEVNEEVESASGPGWGVWTTDPYYTAAQMQAYARAAVEQGAPEGWTLVPRVPVTGPRYEAGEWSRRNWEAALDDLAAAPAPQGE